MINSQNNYVEYSLLLMGLAETREHLDTLILEMSTSDKFSEEDFEVQISHIYAHLNRAWNGRNYTGEMTFEQHRKFNEFPSDIEPVG